ncbi:MAG: quinone-dependent dihydroorotate dehydrogenase [Ectothiorhodospiraceae bacterium]|nr:quinone-dependent dihydroorotate dehydrogenase [Ectothiorhodospiraceae bacterium]
MAYSLLRSLLFRLDPEHAHELSLRALRASRPLGVPRLLTGVVPRMETHLLGLRFPNPVGLAAGLDKNGDYIRALAGLGFGFIEVGTVTPRPQAGNPRPRMFRLPHARGLINRMGFNNKGVDYLVNRVAQSGYQGVLGINIGKNFDTPVERAAEDYLHCLAKVYPYASYVTVNVSSPNTPGLRDLQHGGMLDELLAAVKGEQMRLSLAWNRYVPIVVKIAPDMTDEQIIGLADALVRHGMDAVAATNTTLAREGVEGEEHAAEAGGLSGAPLRDRSTHVIRVLNDHLQGALPIIGIGGIMSGHDAVIKLRAGASLVQLYSGLVYRGPALIGETVRSLADVESVTVPLQVGA